MTDHRRVPVQVPNGQAIIDDAIGRQVEVAYLEGASLTWLSGSLGICPDSGEIVVETDGGAAFVPIVRMVKIQVRR